MYLMSLILSFLSPESSGHSQSSSMPCNIHHLSLGPSAGQSPHLDGVLLVQLVEGLREVSQLVLPIITRLRGHRVTHPTRKTAIELKLTETYLFSLSHQLIPFNLHPPTWRQ